MAGKLVAAKLVFILSYCKTTNFGASLVQWITSSKRKSDDQSSDTSLFLSPATACSAAAAANDAVLVKMSKAQGNRKRVKYHTYSDELRVKMDLLLSTEQNCC